MRECLRLTVAGAVGLTTLILRRRQVEQLTRSGDVLDAPAVGERTVVADEVSFEHCFDLLRKVSKKRLLRSMLRACRFDVLRLISPESAFRVYTVV